VPPSKLDCLNYVKNQGNPAYFNVNSTTPNTVNTNTTTINNDTCYITGACNSSDLQTPIKNASSSGSASGLPFNFGPTDINNLDIAKGKLPKFSNGTPLRFVSVPAAVQKAASGTCGDLLTESDCTTPHVPSSWTEHSSLFETPCIWQHTGPAQMGCLNTTFKKAYSLDVMNNKSQYCNSAIGLNTDGSGKLTCTNS
jgi:hypothetical protein